MLRKSLPLQGFCAQKRRHRTHFSVSASEQVPRWNLSITGGQQWNNSFTPQLPKNKTFLTRSSSAPFGLAPLRSLLAPCKAPLPGASAGNRGRRASSRKREEKGKWLWVKNGVTPKWVALANGNKDEDLRFALPRVSMTLTWVHDPLILANDQPWRLQVALYLFQPHPNRTKLLQSAAGELRSPKSEAPRDSIGVGETNGYPW